MAEVASNGGLVYPADPAIEDLSIVKDRSRESESLEENLQPFFEEIYVSGS